MNIILGGIGSILLLYGSIAFYVYISELIDKFYKKTYSKDLYAKYKNNDKWGFKRGMEYLLKINFNKNRIELIANNDKKKCFHYSSFNEFFTDWDIVSEEIHYRDINKL